MKNNPFYICEKFWLMVYPTVADAEKACSSRVTRYACGVNSPRIGSISYGAEKLSAELGCRVMFCSPGEPIFVANKDGIFWNVIIGEKIGWIIAREKADIKPIENPFK